MKNYCVLLPQNFNEYIMLLNLFFYYNKGPTKHLIIYSQVMPDDNNNIFTINDLKSYDDVKPLITTKLNLKDYQKITILNLFLNTLIFNKINITLNNLYSKMFITKFMITRQFIKKKTKNKAIILIKLSEQSIKNIIYYIIALQSIYKIEYVKENDNFDNNSKINFDDNDFHIIIYSQVHANEKQNIIFVKQFIHQLCIALPRLKNSFMNTNEMLEDFIQQNMRDHISFILYNLCFYNIIYTKEDLNMAIANYCNNNSNIIYPEKVLNDNLIQMLKIKLDIINYKTITKEHEIENKRLINI